jgi:hypothetical protein
MSLPDADNSPTPFHDLPALVAGHARERPQATALVVGDERLSYATLDALAAAHGMPDFVKIDVEGWEAEVLAGLSTAPRGMSFEFTTIQRNVAEACLSRLTALGLQHFNACLGESMDWAFPAPVGATAMAEWLRALPAEANSGDVYAALEPASLTA